MERKNVEETIHSIHYDFEDAPLLVKDLPKDLQPDDKIYCISDPGYFSENNSWNANTEYKITRLRPQTDKEYQDDCDWWAKKHEESRVARYKEYLRLKEEVETGKLTRWNYVMSDEERAKFEKYSEMKFLSADVDDSEDDEDEE